MKKILFVCLVMLQLACNGYKNEDSFFINESLDSILSDYIKEKKTNKIFYLFFCRSLDRIFVTIQCSGKCYNSDYIDGVFSKNGKLICYYSINKTLADSYIHIPYKLQCVDSLKKYTNVKKELVNNDVSPAPRTYILFNKHDFVLAKASDFVSKTKAHDTTVVKNKQINQILNNFINENEPIITYIRFKHIKKNLYVCVGNDLTYEKKDFVGMFYRNKRVVVVYSDRKRADSNIIENGKLHGLEEMSEYRMMHREIQYGIRDIYLLEADSAKRVAYENPEYMNLRYD